MTDGSLKNFLLAALIGGLTGSMTGLTGCRNTNEKAAVSAERPDGDTSPALLEAVEELPETSLYLQEGEWHSQDNDTLQLGSLRGKIPLVAMIFTHCEFACPRIIADMKKIGSRLPPGKSDDVVFVLVSFDSRRDRPDMLKAFAEKMHLGDNWLLLHGDEDEVRTLSMLLDVRYQPQAGGTFAHANVITLLDRQGVVVSRLEGLGSDPGAILSTIGRL